MKAIIDAPFSHNIACGLRQLLVGENPLDHERLWQKMYRRTMYFGRKAVGITAMAAVDMALWDLKGKAFGQPIHRLLGGKQHDRVRGYASILFGRDGKETARHRPEVGGGRLHGGEVRLGADGHVRSGGHRSRARAPRRAWQDTRCSSTRAACTTPAPRCGGRTRSRSTRRSGSRNRCARTTSTGYVWLRDRSPIPIAAGEGECGRESFRPFIDRQALDVYQVDLSRCGFTDAAYIRARVEEIGARLCNHCYTSPLTVAASMHWLSTCRDAFVFEDCVEDSPLRHDLTHEKVQSVDGWMEVPDRPGLGVTLDEKFVTKYLVAESK